MAEFNIDLGKMKVLFDQPKEEIPFSKLLALARSDVEDSLTHILPHYLKKHRFKYAKIDFELLLRNVFEDVHEGFDPHDYLYVVNVKQLDGIQRVYSHHDKKTIANLIGFHTFLRLLDHMPHSYRQLKAEFDLKTLNVSRATERDATCGRMIAEKMPLVIAHLLFNRSPDRRNYWKLSQTERTIQEYLKVIVKKQCHNVDS